MKQQLMLEYKSASNSMTAVATFMSVMFIGTVLFGYGNLSDNYFIPTYLGLQFCINENMTLAYVLPLSKKEIFIYDVLTTLIKVSIYALMYTLMIVLNKGQAEDYIFVLYSSLMMFVIVLIFRTMVTSFKKKIGSFFYYGGYILLITAGAFVIGSLNLWPMENYVYSLAITLIAALIILPLHYHFYDRFGHDARMIVRTKY